MVHSQGKKMADKYHPNTISGVFMPETKLQMLVKLDIPVNSFLCICS